LSNIDSVDAPGIAGLTRFEHVLGVAHLASEVGFLSKLSQTEAMLLKASALLHDWAITSFGHLVEEALQYVGSGFDHQERLSEISMGATSDEIGGEHRQILVGRETGLRDWLWKVTGSRQGSDKLLSGIQDTIRGTGQFGKVISGDIDLDNVDNVFRMAYHLGLAVDRALPIRLASAMSAVDQKTGNIVFNRSARGDIEIWRSVRTEVYENLMLAPHDFAGKLMLLFSTIRCFEEGEIRKVDWSLTDSHFITGLLASGVKEARETAARWVSGELWNCTPLEWMSGDRPTYPRMRAFSRLLSDRLDRTCLAYAIADKRHRKLSICFEDGSALTTGHSPQQWLLGIGSPERRAFSASEIAAIYKHALDMLDARAIGPASSQAQLALL